MAAKRKCVLTLEVEYEPELLNENDLAKKLDRVMKDACDQAVFDHVFDGDGNVEVGKFMAPGDNWSNVSIQFPRLLAEIRSAGLTPDQMKILEESMDLNEGDITSIFLRAEDEWERIKKNLFP